MFTPAEAAAFVDLPPKRVHKEIEKKVIGADKPPRLDFFALVYLRALKLLDIELPVQTRAEIYRQLGDALRRSESVDEIEVAKLLTLHVATVTKELASKVERFQRWREGLVSNPEIMAGETVFPNSRVTVRGVGGRLERGEIPEVLLEDYPQLTQDDLEFARLFVRAYPRVGRPPTDRSSAHRRRPLAVGRAKARQRGRHRRGARS
ncbi:MAG: DUF433 domain-containing protein [Deltaproteobacteria bacterium]|nr:DUF433 domain-containing protein [Deltaproteobacteria bacterium]